MSPHTSPPHTLISCIMGVGVVAIKRRWWGGGGGRVTTPTPCHTLPCKEHNVAWVGMCCHMHYGCAWVGVWGDCVRGVVQPHTIVCEGVGGKGKGEQCVMCHLTCVMCHIKPCVVTFSQKPVPIRCFHVAGHNAQSGTHLRVSHSLAVPSPLAVTALRPLLVTATSLTQPVCPSSTLQGTISGVW